MVGTIWFTDSCSENPGKLGFVRGIVWAEFSRLNCVWDCATIGVIIGVVTVGTIGYFISIAPTGIEFLLNGLSSLITLAECDDTGLIVLSGTVRAWIFSTAKV